MTSRFWPIAKTTYKVVVGLACLAVAGGFLLHLTALGDGNYAAGAGALLSAGVYLLGSLSRGRRTRRVLAALIFVLCIAEAGLFAVHQGRGMAASSGWCLVMALALYGFPTRQPGVAHDQSGLA
jgi:hypothetical protein